MSSWGSGYVTDIEYSDGFYPSQVPAYMALAATLAGFEPPPAEGDFTYCELGCGRGMTSTILGAINLDAEIHAIDFNPAHIAHARDHAKRAGVGNVTFHDCSFEDLSGPRGAALPMFDVVTLHGVWAWIGPQLQDAIIAFLNFRLKPGGAVYVSYNALPGWVQAAPLQRLIREIAAEIPQRSDIAVERAIAQVGRLFDANIIPERFNEAAKRFKFNNPGKNLQYFAHEYLNQHWQPVYFADVARAFAGAKLTFIACSELVKNFYNLVLSEPQRKLIAEISSQELREMLKDFSTDNWFRQDVFMRGARRISERRREQLLARESLALLRPAPESFEISKPDGSRWRPDARVYDPVLAALKRGPRTVGELLTLDVLPPDHRVGAVELVGMLAGTGVAGLYRQPSAAQIDSAQRFNAALDADPEAGLDHGAVIAVPAARVGVSLSPPIYALYLSLRRGETRSAAELAALFIERCRARGGHPVIDDKTYEDPVEALTAVTHDYEVKISNLVPIWRMLGMV